MLSANVLCIKKKKKKSYCIYSKAENGTAGTEKHKRSAGVATTMLQITEDTPPDMLAGAMDLTVHLPTGKSVKMSVERSTPMMDLLVQITTNYHFQLSGYTLQVLGMAPSKEHSDTILPYKPNTPIGALDTQHIRVVPKSRTTSVPKNVAPGHQPFESTFRLKVHLPRNQLYVTRVSHSVHLEDIMKKVCEEKNLDPLKYEFRHPGNLNELLNPKLTLNDYTITEIYLVQKGTANLNQTFSTSDIMALRKEEERKQMHNKTGGGVFNLIFRRGKSSTGSLSSENRSISPTHSDDSRSVTPPGVQQQIITPPDPPPPDKPKPPQRKRRPAPKPPTEIKKPDAGLTVCHSRNSSDSSGYHEASILSDNCNTSLPRRPKSTMVSEEAHKALGQHSQSTSNLSKMAVHSKSTSSLAFPNRKKKTAPPPPPVLKSERTEPNLEEPPSPVVASQPCTVAQTETPGNGQDVVVNNTNPKPTPRIRTKTAPSPRPRSLVALSFNDVKETNESSLKESEAAVEALNENVGNVKENEETAAELTNEETVKRSLEEGEAAAEALNENVINVEESAEALNEHVRNEETPNSRVTEAPEALNEYETFRESLNRDEVTPKQSEISVEDASKASDKDSVTKSPEDAKEVTPKQSKVSELSIEDPSKASDKDPEVKDPVPKSPEDAKASDFDVAMKQKFSDLAQLQKTAVNDILGTPNKSKPPEVVALHPKPKSNPKSMFDSYTRKRGFQIGSSLIDLNNGSPDRKTSSGTTTPNSVESALNAFEFVDEIEGLDVEMFTESLSKNSKNKNIIINQLHGMHELEKVKKSSAASLRSVNSFPGFMTGMKKWNNVEELDDISLHSYSGRNGWVIGDSSDTESVASINTSQSQQPVVKTAEKEEVAKPVIPETKSQELHKNELDADWQYQLPSPPKAFRDSSPVAFVNHESVADSVVTSPELFEKLKVVKDNQSEKETTSDLTSMVSEEERPILNKLSLENLEKRKSLVYNRELATSLKMSDEERKPDTFSTSLLTFEKTYDEVKQSSLKQITSTLPNFKITTYNHSKQKIDIFEDDTIRSNDRGSKRNSFTSEPAFPLQKNYIGRSMENISFRKNSIGRSSDEEFKSNEYKFYRPPVKSQVFRSESFTKEPKWIPVKPVSRSKSQVALNRYKESKTPTQEDEALTKSNSLFDVSGLQSLGVMRLIQNKLNTPNTSTEQLDKDEPSYQKPPEVKNEVQIEEKPPVKTYKYTPPSVNMGTWSERPKLPVNMKEDPDYKYSKDRTSKLIVNTINNDVKSHNSIEIRNKSTTFSNSVSVRVGDNSNKNVSIKVNGFEPVQNSGNVVIKIGADNSVSKPMYRKPLGNVNANQRPHSIAFGNEFDISRVPIVRSVEFKKPYKDHPTPNNTSITQIGGSNFNGYKDTESTIKPQVEPKPVFRVNSYLQNSSAPVVRGFRNGNEVNRTSWSQPHSFSTLPTKPRNFALNAPVPFSQANLRRTESTTKSVPPPAPVMPKVFHNVKNRDDSGDPKEQLLQAIRDFGGKKGLRAVKA